MDYVHSLAFKKKILCRSIWPKHAHEENSLEIRPSKCTAARDLLEGGEVLFLPGWNNLLHTFFLHVVIVSELLKAAFLLILCFTFIVCFVFCLHLVCFIFLPRLGKIYHEIWIVIMIRACVTVVYNRIKFIRLMEQAVFNALGLLKVNNVSMSFSFH